MQKDAKNQLLWVMVVILALLLLGNIAIATEAGGADEDSLWDMSIDELLSTEVVSASKKTEKLREAPTNMVVVTDQQIKEWGVKDLKEVLQRVAGYNVVADRDEWCFGARGNVSDNNQKYLVVLDGHRMYSINNFGPGNIIELPMDLSNVKRIEIIKGPGSVVWGNAAISGVISIYTKNPEDLNGKTVNVGTAVGSNDTYRTNAQVGKDFSWGSLMIMGAGVKSGGKEVMQSSATSNRPILETKSSSFKSDHPHGTYRTDLERQEPGGMIHIKSKFKEKFSVNAFALENSIFNRHYESNYGRSNFLQNKKYYIEGIYDEEVLGGDFTFKLSHHSNFAKYHNENDVTGLPPSQLEIEWVDKNYNAAVSYARDLIPEVLALNSGVEYTNTKIGPNDAWSSTAGANTDGTTPGPNTVDVVPTAMRSYSPKTITRDENVFGYAVLDWYITKQFKLIGGTGMDYCEDRGKDNLVFSPRAAAIYHFNEKVTGKLIWNQAFLRPSNFQSGVNAEEMDQAEGILMMNFGRTNLTATLFWQQLRGFIAIVSIGSGFANSGDYTSQGLELEATTKLTENHELWANASYVNAKATNFSSDMINTKTNSIRTDHDGRVLSVPDLMFNFGATFRYLEKKVFVSPALRWRNAVTYRSAPPTAGDASLTTAGYDKIPQQTYFDLAFGYEPCDHFGLYATIMNLTDVNTQNHLTIWNGTVGQYGRYMELKAIFKF